MKNVTGFILSSLEGIYSKPTGECSCMLPFCQGPIGRIIIRSDNTDVLLLPVSYFSRGQLTNHLYVRRIY